MFVNIKCRIHSLYTTDATGTVTFRVGRDLVGLLRCVKGKHIVMVVEAPPISLRRVRGRLLDFNV